MSPINEINSSDNAVKLADSLANVIPGDNDILSKQTEDNQHSQSEILTYLKRIDTKVESLHSELASVKEELLKYKKSNEEYQVKIEALESENKHLVNKLNAVESASRLNTLVLSGRSVKINNNSSPTDLLRQSIANIKSTYNFNLTQHDVSNCTKLKGDENKSDRILLTLHSTFTKNDLISSVIKKNKSKGVNLNINEYLSSYNANRSSI